MFNNINDTRRFSRSLLKLEVYYEELNLEAVYEKAAYGVSILKAQFHVVPLFYRELINM